MKMEIDEDTRPDEVTRTNVNEYVIHYSWSIGILASNFTSYYMRKYNIRLVYGG
jgi:hypothetical protein